MKHPRGWRSFMEYGNGIIGDLCIHMLDAARWMLDLGSPKSGQFLRAASSCTRAARRTSPTRRPPSLISATCKWSGSTAAGASRLIPRYPWGVTFWGDKGTLKASIISYDFTPMGSGQAHPPRRH